MALKNFTMINKYEKFQQHNTGNASNNRKNFGSIKIHNRNRKSFKY